MSENDAIAAAIANLKSLNCARDVHTKSGLHQHKALEYQSTKITITYYHCCAADSTYPNYPLLPLPPQLRYVYMGQVPEMKLMMMMTTTTGTSDFCLKFKWPIIFSVLLLIRTVVICWQKILHVAQSAPSNAMHHHVVSGSDRHNNATPVLYYCLEACPLKKSQLSAVDFALNCTFRKIFSTRSQEVVDGCKQIFSCQTPSDAVADRKCKFSKKFIVSDNMLCQVFKDVAMDELALLASKLIRPTTAAC